LEFPTPKIVASDPFATDPEETKHEELKGGARYKGAGIFIPIILQVGLLGFICESRREIRRDVVGDILGFSDMQVCAYGCE
jgi:hypothetical protein